MVIKGKHNLYSMLRYVNLDFLCIFSVALWSKGIYVSSSWGKMTIIGRWNDAVDSFLIKNIYLQTALKSITLWPDGTSHLTPMQCALFALPEAERCVCVWDGWQDWLCDFDGDDIHTSLEDTVGLRVDMWQRLEPSVTSRHGTRHSEHGGSREGFSGSTLCVPWRSQGWNTALSKVQASHVMGLEWAPSGIRVHRGLGAGAGRQLKPSHHCKGGCEEICWKTANRAIRICFIVTHSDLKTKKGGHQPPRSSMSTISASLLK